MGLLVWGKIDCLVQECFYRKENKLPSSNTVSSKMTGVGSRFDQ